jgi:hypothetical protein
MDWHQLEAMADRLARDVAGNSVAEVVRIIEEDAVACLSRRDALRLSYLQEAQEAGSVDHARIDAQVELDIADSLAPEAGLDI